jgi:hypothetical protein
LSAAERQIGSEENLRLIAHRLANVGSKGGNGDQCGEAKRDGRYRKEKAATVAATISPGHAEDP